MSAPPLSRLVTASEIPAEGVDVEIVADAGERAALAAANETVSVESFVARLNVRPHGKGGLRATGTLEADATRTCVVTLEPFVERVSESIEVRFSPDQPSPDAEDPPDPLVGGKADLGVVAAEFFTLGLDPHPRKPGAVFDGAGLGGEAETPFAALRKLVPPSDPSE
jgi:hypothetical protein